MYYEVCHINSDFIDIPITNFHQKMKMKTQREVVYRQKVINFGNLKMYAAKLRTSTGMHNDQKYGKSIMTSHEISDRDNGAEMLII